MDSFYASVEQRDNPNLAEKPVAVGSTAESLGVAATASCDARKLGRRNASRKSKWMRCLRPESQYGTGAEDRTLPLFFYNAGARVSEAAQRVVANPQQDEMAPPLVTLRGNGAAAGVRNLVHGIGPCTAIAESKPRFISTETTFAQNIVDLDHPESVLLDSVQEIAARMRLKGLLA